MWGATRDQASGLTSGQSQPKYSNHQLLMSVHIYTVLSTNLIIEARSTAFPMNAHCGFQRALSEDADFVSCAGTKNSRLVNSTVKYEKDLCIESGTPLNTTRSSVATTFPYSTT